MSTKRPSLAASLQAVAEDTPSPSYAPEPAPSVQPEEQKTRPQGFFAATRIGKKKATAPLSVAAHRQLKTLALDKGSTVERLLIEAINDLFRKNGKSPIA